MALRELRDAVAALGEARENAPRSDSRSPAILNIKPGDLAIFCGGFCTGFGLSLQVFLAALQTLRKPDKIRCFRQGVSFVKPRVTPKNNLKSYRIRIFA